MKFPFHYPLITIGKEDCLLLKKCIVLQEKINK